MPDAHANGAISTVATAPSPATSGTSLVVAAGHGVRFPTPPFNATIKAAGAPPVFSVSPNAEIVRVTARSTDTFTLVRAQESTTARTVVVGDDFEAAITVDTFEQLTPPRYMELPTGWDTVWKTKRDASGSALANILCLGMSGQSGLGATTDYLTNSYIGKIRSGLVSRGFTIAHDFYNSLINTLYYGAYIGTPPFIYTTNPPNMTPPLPYGLHYVASAASTTPTWTWTERGTGSVQFDIIVLDQGAGTFTYNLNGGSSQVITNVGALGGKPKRITITSGHSGWNASISQVINITAQNGAFILMWMGVIQYASTTAGIGFTHQYYPGAGLSDFGRTDQVPKDKLVLLQGNAQDDLTAPDTTFGLPHAPHHLVICELGGNDAGIPNTRGSKIGYGPDAYFYGLQRMVDATRRSVPSCSWLFVGFSIPSSPSNTYNYNTVDSPGNWAMYLSKMREFARQNGCGFINFDDKWELDALGAGYISTLDFHPDDSGYEEMANVILSVLEA